MIIRAWALLAFLYLPVFIANASGHYRERERTYDVLHYSLVLDVDLGKKSVSVP